MSLRSEIMRLNRSPVLGSWFSKQLDNLIRAGYYQDHIDALSDSIVTSLSDYREKSQKEVVIIGISGGIDSAVTALLYQKAGYRVIGVLMPIHQNPEETDRAMELCRSCNIDFLVLDLTTEYDMFVSRAVVQYDTFLLRGIRYNDAVRRGNIRARLRMMTLYNLAQMNNGFVASTDNFSELAAGFWTLHGDVGDVAPIQSLTKSWEIPRLAEHLGVPDSIVTAVPTDGLGIANGDEDQLGFSYLQFDIAVLTLMDNNITQVLNEISDEAEREVLLAVAKRVNNTAFKRNNPYNLEHPVDGTRFDRLATLDQLLSNINLSDTQE